MLAGPPKALEAPIYPVAYAADRAIRLRSWDRLMIPLPFARLLVEVGFEPICLLGREQARLHVTVSEF
jgi:lysophospholipid acyltransferase (LPLAT)-like uncharacterized protein